MKEYQLEKFNLNAIETQQVLAPVKPREIANIVDFNVTTDSVVAKVTFVSDTESFFVKLDWGDGTVDNIDQRLGSSNIALGGNSLPPGTYEFYHRYDINYIIDPRGGGEGLRRPAPEDFDIDFRVTDSDGAVATRFQTITIKPKYRINFFRLYVGLKGPCDSSFESENEFSIIQKIDGEIKNEWKWNPSNNFFFTKPTVALEGSENSHEFEIDDPFAFPTKSVIFKFVEKDFWFDDVVSLGYTVKLFINQEQEQFTILDEDVTTGDGCSIMHKVEGEVKLLVPLPNNPNFVFKKA